MTKTQIQLPDALYRDLKRLAAAREWSLAETLRRAAEQFLARYPAETTPTHSWRPPVSDTAGWRGSSHEAVHAAALDDLELREVENTPSAERRHPRWMLLGFDSDSPALHEDLWPLAARRGSARRRIYDARLALTLLRQGVTEFATANLKDFRSFGFDRVWNPVG